MVFCRARVSTGVPMGIIPRGTANAFSVALGIPTHLDDPINFATQAAEVILQVGCATLSARHQPACRSGWDLRVAGGWALGLSQDRASSRHLET